MKNQDDTILWTPEQLEAAEEVRRAIGQEIAALLNPSDDTSTARTILIPPHNERSGPFQKTYQDVPNVATTHVEPMSSDTQIRIPKPSSRWCKKLHIDKHQ